MTLLFSFLMLYFYQAGAVFLLITPGAKAVAMGSAFSALANDATAIYYNPGGLAFHNHTNITSMNLSPPAGVGREMLSVWLEYVEDKYYDRQDIPLEPGWLTGLHPDMRHLYFGAVYPYKDICTFGFGYNSLIVGETVTFDAEGNVIYRYSSYDYSLSFSCAREFYKGLGIGASLKYIHSFLMPNKILIAIYGYDVHGTARSIAVDIGAMYKTPLPGLALGISLQNLGFDMKFPGETGDPLPRHIRYGLALEPIALVDWFTQFPPANIKLPFMPSTIFRYEFARDWVTDLVGSEHQTWRCSGHEFTFLNIFSLRYGYFEEWENYRARETTGYALNLGRIKFEIGEEDPSMYDFSTETNWRVQISLSSYESDEPSFIKNNKTLNNTVALLSSLVVPGGGQFYTGEDFKGLLLLGGALCLAEWNYRNSSTLFKIGLGTLYLTSLVDIIQTLLHN